MKELYEAFALEIERAAFSLIAARTLHDEITDERTNAELRDIRRRHRRHLRAHYTHMRKAKRIRRKIKRYDEKRNSHRSA